MTEISKEYAGALFALARESRAEEAFSAALAFVLAQFSAQPAYYDLLAAPNVPITERRELLSRSFGATVPEYVLSFLQLLCDGGHIRLLGNCVAEYQTLFLASRAISDARVVSAVPLTEEEKKALHAKLEKISGHRVAAHYETDEGLLGGLIVYMDDKVIDGSLRHQLKETKEVIGK